LLLDKKIMNRLAANERTLVTKMLKYAGLFKHDDIKLAFYNIKHIILCFSKTQLL